MWATPMSATCRGSRSSCAVVVIVPVDGPQADDGLDELGLAVALDAGDGDDLAGTDIERDALDGDMVTVVADDDVLEAERRPRAPPDP